MATDTRDRRRTRRAGNVLRGISWKDLLPAPRQPAQLPRPDVLPRRDAHPHVAQYVHDGNGWLLALIGHRGHRGPPGPTSGHVDHDPPPQGGPPSQGLGQGARSSTFYIGENELRIRVRKEDRPGRRPAPQPGHRGRQLPRLQGPEALRPARRARGLAVQAEVEDALVRPAGGRPLRADRPEPQPAQADPGSRRPGPGRIRTPMGETDWKPWLRAWAVELPEPPATP